MPRIFVEPVPTIETDEQCIAAMFVAVGETSPQAFAEFCGIPVDLAVNIFSYLVASEVCS
jgi:hypothetical protein